MAKKRKTSVPLESQSLACADNTAPIAVMHPPEYYTTLVSGIVCRKCGYELPEMTMAQHLDTPTHLQHEC